GLYLNNHGSTSLKKVIIVLQIKKGSQIYNKDAFQFFNDCFGAKIKNVRIIKFKLMPQNLSSENYIKVE
ncbi:hypothetical protein BpHYR1_049760, partial [Brachionus plicatilis]